MSSEAKRKTSKMLLRTSSVQRGSSCCTVASDCAGCAYQQNPNHLHDQSCHREATDELEQDHARRSRDSECTGGVQGPCCTRSKQMYRHSCFLGEAAARKQSSDSHSKLGTHVCACHRRRLRFSWNGLGAMRWRGTMTTGTDKLKALWIFWRAATDWVAKCRTGFRTKVLQKGTATNA